jgi:hypothetical protein
MYSLFSEIFIMFERTIKRRSPASSPLLFRKSNMCNKTDDDAHYFGLYKIHGFPMSDITAWLQLSGKQKIKVELKISCSIHFSSVVGIWASTFFDVTKEIF